MYTLHLTPTPTPKTPKLMGVLSILFGPNIPWSRVLNGVQEYGFIFEQIKNTNKLNELKQKGKLIKLINKTNFID